MNSTSRRSVIIVDDDTSYTKLLTQVLVEHLDRPVISFVHPKEALEALPRLNAALVIAGCELQDLDGRNFIAEAAKLVPAAAFILITGTPLTAAMEAEIATGPVKSVLCKPLTWRKLLDEIVRHWPSTTSAPFRAAPASV